MRLRRSILVASILTFAGALPSAVAAQQQAPPGCAGEQYDDFDFWIGAWTVTSPAGATIGSSRIERASMGCAILESWTDARGIDGHSINFFEREADAWNQVWMGANGSVLRLTGGSDRPGRMIMTGERPTPQGTVSNRITWTLLDDGTVEQLWETSSDAGATWQTGFRGVYHRVN